MYIDVRIRVKVLKERRVLVISMQLPLACVLRDDIRSSSKISIPFVLSLLRDIYRRTPSTSIKMAHKRR